MRFRTATGLLTGLLTALFAQASPDTVRVTGNNVNLRSVAGADGEVVGQVSKGDLLERFGTEGEWTRVKPPEDVALWVYGELLQGGVVAVPKLMVRGGPGINYKAVGHLVDGDRVTVRGEHAGWLSIAPPPGCFLWISSAYVQDAAQGGPAEVPALSEKRPDAVPAVPAAVPRRQPVPAATGSDNVAATSQTVQRRREAAQSGRTVVEIKPPIVDPRILVSSRDQGRPVEISGLLRPAGRAVWRRPSRYRLVQYDNRGRALTVCYVIADESQLESMTGKHLLISGKEYWVQGVRHPALAAERIAVKP